MIGRGTLFIAAQTIHRGKDSADALAGDRAREQQIDANAAATKLGGKFARQCVHRRLGNGIGGAGIIFGARKDRRNVDDRATFGHRAGGSAHHVPGNDHDVARGIADRFAIGAAGGLQGFKVVAAERQIFERLLGAGGAGIVDQHIDMAMARHDFGDAGADAFRIGAIDHHRRGAFCANARRGQRGIARRIGAGAIAPREHHRRAFGEITASDRLPQIAGSAGDQCNLASKSAGRDFGGGGLGHRRCFQFEASGWAEDWVAAQASKSSSRLRSPIAGKAWLTM